MDNHIHLVIRVRPDQVEKWSDEAVLKRYHSLRTVVDWGPAPLGSLSTGDSARLASRIDEARIALTNPSFFMRAIKEGFSRLLNREQRCAGHVWESRYNDVSLLDAGAVFACMVYVDLNPLRADLPGAKGAAFCSIRPHRGMKVTDPGEAHLAKRLWGFAGYPVLDDRGHGTGGFRRV